MLETAVLLTFIAALAAYVASGASILWALAGGYLIFCGYGLIRGHRPRALLRMSLDGVRTVKNILMIFGLIGFITALWRGAGTIPVIVCWAADLIDPSVFLLIAFLLNCLISVLTGTSFGTGATMGVITMSMASAMGLSPFWLGGAILSGIYFGDRCSPVSSSANLVCVLTGTDIYENIRGMIRTGLVPFALSCLFYYLAGRTMAGEGELLDVSSLFAGSFRLHAAAVVPAALILILSLLRVKVKQAMALSILSAVVICAVLQGFSAGEILSMAVFGYRSADPALAPMLDGGGLISMVRVGTIVCLSSSYAGLFQGTGLLNGIQGWVERLSRRITPYGAVLAVSVFTSMIACNQTLAAMLTHQICKTSQPDAKKMAIDLENTAIILSPLVPWCIAGAVPLAAVGAPTASVTVAVYLYLVPLWNLFAELSGIRKMGEKRRKKV